MPNNLFLMVFKKYNSLLNHSEELSLIFHRKTLYFTKYMYMLSGHRDIRIRAIPERSHPITCKFTIVIYINFIIYFSGIVPDFINTTVQYM